MPNSSARRLALISLHTSPAAQPGAGDAGGLNVYALNAAREIAAAGHTVDIFTADPQLQSGGQQAPRELGPGIRAHLLETRAQTKEELTADIDILARQLSEHPDYRAAECVWAHYWISADAALRAKPHKPTAVSFHTMAAVKERDFPGHSEPAQRLEAERRIAQTADTIVANTPAEAEDAQDLLGAKADRVLTAPPGVRADIFTPGDQAEARSRVGVDADLLVLGVGRMQRVKGTDLAIETLASLRALRPDLVSRTRMVQLGAASGDAHDSVYTELAERLGVAEVLEIREPVPAEELADWYRAADVVIVPSRSESFGFVAAEASAAGRAVLASRVGGLEVIVDSGATGILLAKRDHRLWAEELARLLDDAGLRDRLGRAAHKRAQRFTWQACAEKVMEALTVARAGGKPAGRNE